MQNLSRSDIVGARIVKVHATYEDLDGCDGTTIYFTVDRGFSFILPWPRYPLERVTVPAAAYWFPDERYSEERYEFEGTYPSRHRVWKPREKSDSIVNRLKERTIHGIYCRHLNGADDSDEPDDAFLAFDDGTRAFCVSVAPHGLRATGLYYDPDVCHLPKVCELIDYFDLPHRV